MEPLAVFRRGGRSLHQAFDIPTLAAPLQAGVESRGMKAEGALNGGQESLPSGLGIVSPPGSFSRGFWFDEPVTHSARPGLSGSFARCSRSCRSAQGLPFPNHTGCPRTR